MTDDEIRKPDAPDWRNALRDGVNQKEELAEPLQPPDGWWELAFGRTLTQSEIDGHRCGEHEMLTLVAYDICDRRRLVQVAKHCEDHGVRIQNSVFECRLEADRFDRFWEGLLELIDESEDCVTAYLVCKNCARKVRDGGMQVHSEKVIAYVF